MIDLNKFYAQYCADSTKTKFKMIQFAAEKIFMAMRENYYSPSDLDCINFSEICEWCDWPDFQDGGIFEQAIAAAVEVVRAALR